MDDSTLDLSTLPEIGDLPDETLPTLATARRSADIPSGWTTVHQSEPVDKGYSVLAGRSDMVRSGARVATLGPGSPAGEMGLVDHRLRYARLSTTGPVRVLAWTDTVFAQLREQWPEFDAHVRHVT